MRYVETMSRDELLAESAKVRRDLVASAERLFQVCDVLHSNVRRERTVDDLAPVLLSMANVGKRLAGVVLQSAKRTASMDRTLEATKQRIQDDKEHEARRKKEAEKRRERSVVRAQKRRDPYGIFTSTDITALYGDAFAPSAAPVVDDSDDEDDDE